MRVCYFGRMFTHEGLLLIHSWTHESLDILFQHAASLPQELLLRNLAGFGSPSVRDQLVHVLAVESRWMHAVQKRPLPEWRSSEYRTLESLLESKSAVVADTQEFIRSLTAEELNAVRYNVAPEWIGPPRSPAFVVHHVITHAFHHKGQIAAMFRLLGSPAPDTDLQRAS